MSNSLTTLSTLHNEITDLQRKLSPAGDETVAKALASLRTAGLRAPEGIPAAEINKVYSFALSGLAGYALNKTIRRIIQGEIEGITAFIPTPPELAKLTRAEQAKITEDLIRAKATAEAMKPEQRPERTPEMIERVRMLREGFLAQHKMNKEHERRNAEPDLPFDATQNEYWLKIAALKDAPGELNADQRIFRAKIFGKLKAAGKPVQEAAE